MNLADECCCVIDRLEKLDSSPALLAKVKDLSSRPEVGLSQLAEVLRLDVSLTASVIKVSNSAYYGFEIESSNLMTAMGRIGLDEVLRIVGVVLTQNLFAEDLTVYQQSRDEFFAESVATALLMEAIARQVGENAQDAYTVGLLHRVGRLVIQEVAADQAISVQYDQQELTRHQWEMQAFSFSAAQAGGQLLRRWKFPARICHIIDSSGSLSFNEDEDILLNALVLAKLVIRQVGSSFEQLGCLDVADVPLAEIFLFHEVEFIRKLQDLAKASQRIRANL